MEVATKPTTTKPTTTTTTTTTNNHHNHAGHSNHFLKAHHQEQQQRMPHHSQNGLSVGLISEANGNGARSPFQREVREWQRIDPDTGALLSGRLEADRWINGPMNSYGKISDSQNISQPNGTQHTQRKQLEVLQARTANGAMQVIRAQTVQTTSSRWSSATSSASSSAVASPTIATGALTSHLNNHSTQHNISNSFHNSSPLFHKQHNHFQSPSFGRLDLSMASPPALMPTLEITEVINGGSSSNGHSVHHSSQSNSSQSSCSDLEDIDDDVEDDGSSSSRQHHHHQLHHKANGGSNDFLNRHSFLNKSHNNIANRNLSLLMETLETAPSLKLSNLMKSNSSLSSNNSSSNASTTTINCNTHQRGGSAAGKISLHAIVGGGGEEQTKRTSAASSSSSSTALSSATATVTNWQQQSQQQTQRSSRLFEQATLYGNGNLNLSPGLTKSRVGVSAADDDGGANAADEPNDGAPRLKRNDNVTPTQQLKSRQQRRDLESFRHYNEHGSTKPTSTSTEHNNDADDDDILRIKTRHQRRQQIPASSTTSTTTTTTPVPIQRSRSISTDDLCTDHQRSRADSYDEADDLEPSEWKRVSKLRRSFQSSNSSKSDISIQPRRPIDLPTNSSVSVAKIRAELENGRRLNTAMRNNHVDLAALDSILNGPANDESSKPVPAKRNSFLTAESLKEIRAGLKKLSDESLYRDDYVAATQAAPDEHIEIQDVKKPPERIRPRQPTPENYAEKSAPKSAFQVFTRPAPSNSFVITAPKHTTHSLESRQKHRDSAASIDWHLRRKSYGFEKMSPPDDKAMCRMDASTDSGLGRSGEQLGSWSPTNTNAPSATHATVIQFGSPVKSETNAVAIKPAIQRRYRPLKSPNENEQEAELKRHSIAVDESQYVRKTSQVRLNGLYDNSAEYTPKSLQSTRLMENFELASANTRSGTQQKRVEFCKTEVHFAAESGRVNIVETDGKPPPTNNFRRRRRTTSGPLQTLMKSGGTVDTVENANTKPITLFGGDIGEHKVLSQTTVAYRASLIEAKTEADTNTNVSAGNTSVTFTTPKAISLDAFNHSEGSRSSYASTSGVETTDCETDEFSSIRGILKNKPIKPKPYHLGENIVSADALWGMQQKPVGNAQQKEAVAALSSTSSSVAERIRLAEQRQDAPNSLPQSNNFSTKINLSLGNDFNTDPEEDLPKSNVMSIELHSPQTSLDRQDATKLKEKTAPVAKPRITSSVKEQDPPAVHSAATIKQTTEQHINKDSNPEFLKIVKETRGARKLREHELSYFGVPMPSKHADNNESNPTFITATHFPKSKRSLPQRKPNDYPQTELISDLAKQQQSTTTKWQLLNDKPDLLRHSPVTAVEPHIITRTTEIKPAERKSLSSKIKNSDLECDEHVYENIATEIKPIFKVKSPVRMISPSYDEHSYDRKTDLKRDAMILSEMTQSADQTMKAISDEAAIKDQRRRSSSQRRHHPKPLETIDEKINAEKINDKCIAVQVTRSTTATESKRRSRHGTPTRTTVSSRARSSSQSSNDSCPRARSRSISSERDYEALKVRSKRTSQSATRSRSAAVPSSRSSSRESAHARCCSSGDERDQNNRRVVRSSRSATKPTAIKNNDSRKSSSKESSSHRHHHHHSADKSQRREDDHSKKRISSSTAHSSRRERVECNDEAKTHLHKTHESMKHYGSSGSRTAAGENSSHGKQREEHHHHKSTSSSSQQRPPSSDKRDRDRLRASEHHHQHNLPPHHETSQHRSSHLRAEREKEREKSSRSRGHSSRSSQQKSERNASSKTRELKKSTQQSNSEIKHYEPLKSSTHSKNTPLTNGHHHLHHQELSNGHHNDNEHIHKLTTATIAAKQREHRSGKDRK